MKILSQIKLFFSKNYKSLIKENTQIEFRSGETGFYTTRWEDANLRAFKIDSYHGIYEEIDNYDKTLRHKVFSRLDIVLINGIKKELL